jgi:uncharacterized protein (TIGR02452 family)
MELTRFQRAKVAQDTLEILKKGQYQTNNNDGNSSGQKLTTVYSIQNELKSAIRGSVLYEPYDDFDQVYTPPLPISTIFTIKLETTLDAAQRIDKIKEGKVGVLNFASAKNPGGGFLKGSDAQEESLSRSSGLFPCIERMDRMYTTNARERKCLYYDFAVYSPQVPVIRDYNGNLQKPYYVDIITCPAPNANVARERGCSEEEINETMKRRIDKVLAIFAKHGCNTLILGSWGTNVFGNYPSVVGGLFKDALMEKYKNVFKHVHFAIWNEERFKCFSNIFGLL